MFNDLDFNYQLLLKELKKSGARLKRVADTPIFLAFQKGQRGLTFDLSVNSTSFPAGWLASDKFLTKKMLGRAGVHVPKGDIFSFEQKKQALSWAKKNGYPVVVKPVAAGHGEYVYSQIENEQDLSAKIDILIKETGFGGNNYFLLETHIPGEEYRLLVNHKNFFAAVHRLPANVIGDGKNSILGLIQITNHQRMNPRINCLCEIKLDDVLFDYLSKHKISIDSVPKKGQVVQLRPTSNVSKGGNCYDVTAKVHPSFKKLAQQVLAAIPGLAAVGVDVICEDISKPASSQSYAVLELNPSPGLSLHALPEKGRKRKASAALAKVFFADPSTQIKKVGKNKSSNRKLNKSQLSKLSKASSLYPQQRSVFKYLMERGWRLELVEKTMLVVFTKSAQSRLFIDGYWSLVPYNIGLILSNKHFTRQVLKANKVSVPKGFLLKPGDVRSALAKAQEIGYPVMLRQENSQLAIPSIFNIHSESRLRKSFSAYSSYGLPMLIEPMITGRTLLVWVNDQGWLSVLERVTQGGGVLSASSQRLEKFENVSSAKTKYIDLTKTYRSKLRPLAQKVLKSFPGLRSVSFEVIANGNKSWLVTEVYHSPTRHYPFVAKKGSKQEKVWRLVAKDID